MAFRANAAPALSVVCAAAMFWALMSSSQAADGLGYTNADLEVPAHIDSMPGAIKWIDADSLQSSAVAAQAVPAGDFGTPIFSVTDGSSTLKVHARIDAVHAGVTWTLN